VRRKLIIRGLLMLLTGVSLYLLAPSLIETFSSWRSLAEISPLWLGVMAVFAAASFVALWEVQRIALGTSSWFAIGTSQLAANAFGRIVPGGAATAGALQYRLLLQSGIPSARVASGITAASLLLFAALLALPILSLPAILGGLRVDPGLERGAYLGGGTFVLMAVAGFVLVRWDRPLELLGRAVQWLLNHIRRRRPPLDDVPERLRHERDSLVAVFGAHWLMTALAVVGRWGFDYMTLVAALAAVGAEVDPSLVLLAYVIASFLSMIPITPGGLGFVEAGLTGTLALAGVSGGEAVVATFAYRLVSFWLPLPAGLGAYFIARRRYGSAPASGSDGDDPAVSEA
jgi:putative heme transporter